MTSIKENILEIKKDLPENVKLIAVSKKQNNNKILEAYGEGHRRFGENYVQELVSKSQELPSDIEWHMIGHLQTNKVKYIAPFVSLIHSVDSFKLLKEINKQAGKNQRIINCLLQVHIAEEETKSGLSEKGLFELLNNPHLKELENIRILGLMGMSTFTDDQNIVSEEFNSLKGIFERAKQEFKDYNLEELSMGMSGDFKLAIEKGSTMVRVGSSIFGARS